MSWPVKTQLLEILTQNAELVGGTSKLGKFMRTKPPTFTNSKEPLDVDDLLCTLEKRLDIARCGNPEKVLDASYLRNPKKTSGATL